MADFLTLHGRLDCRSGDYLIMHRSLTVVTCRSTECLDQHIGGPQTANLGDGNGNVAQTMELRENESPILGTCVESLIGGNHLRMYRQNGTDHPTGALFLACVAYFPSCVYSFIEISCRVSIEEVALGFLYRIYIELLMAFRAFSKTTRSLPMAMMLDGE
jgi:hypothetical protein